MKPFFSTNDTPIEKMWMLREYISTLTTSHDKIYQTAVKNSGLSDVGLSECNVSAVNDALILAIDKLLPDDRHVAQMGCYVGVYPDSFVDDDFSFTPVIPYAAKIDHARHAARSPHAHKIKVENAVGALGNDGSPSDMEDARQFLTYELACLFDQAWEYKNVGDPDGIGKLVQREFTRIFSVLQEEE